MNSQKIAVVVDSCGDVPKEYAAEHDIHVLPVHVIYPERDYLDGVDLDPLMIYDRFPGEIPTTSMPSAGEVDDFINDLVKAGYEKMIAVCISPHLSSTVDTVRMVAAEHTDIKSFVFDTKNISIGSGIFAIWVASKVEDGMSFDEITAKLEAKRYDSHLMFYMNSLDYLHKGGRIGHVTYVIGNTLNIKPLISCDREGIYYMPAKVRGISRAKQKLFDLLVGYAKDNDCWVVIPHGNNKKEADEMEVMFHEAAPHAKILFKEQITASMAVHTGPGLLGLEVLIDP